MQPRRIVFLTGTRADFGKLKSLIRATAAHDQFDVHIFVTGMHMLAKYGQTSLEVERLGVGQIHKFINQNRGDTMDAILGKTIAGLSDYVKEMRPDMLVVHGDRLEALAGASVGALSNILVAHIEGGEVSGTIDELLRHAITKLAHLHFVANDEAKRRLLQLGEQSASVWVIGSPDIDVMKSEALPTIDEVRRHYDIPFDDFAVLLFHPITTDSENLFDYAENLVSAAKASHRNYVVIYPNNDLGSDEILRAYEPLRADSHFRVFPSMRFEYFLSLLRACEFMIGNSSAGVREAPFFGVPSINIGNRQHRRIRATPSVVNCSYDEQAIVEAIAKIESVEAQKSLEFGNGGSDHAFVAALLNPDIWQTRRQKFFNDLN